MKTIAVPVEPTDKMIVAGNICMESPYAYQHTVRGVYEAMLAAAPPQPEPADHLADPDSLERARNALRAIINAGSIGQAKRIAMQALGDKNAAPEQSERESITSPSQEGCAVGTAPVAAPERRIAQRRIGKPWSGIVHARLGYDRRYNAAVESPVPAAPTTMSRGGDALPPSAEEICLAWDKPMTSAEAAKWHMTGGFVAIELYRDERARSRTLVNAAVVATERAEKSETRAGWFKARHEKALSHAFNLGNRVEELETELAELKARAR